MSQSGNEPSQRPDLGVVQTANQVSHTAVRNTQPESVPEPQVEIGGREGPDPVRYGDWEKNGRCIDF